MEKIKRKKNCKTVFELKKMGSETKFVSIMYKFGQIEKEQKTRHPFFRKKVETGEER